MAQMISGKDLAKLRLDLQAPSLLADILKHDRKLSAASDYALRQSFSGLSPVETLISLACCFHILLPHLGSEAGLTAPLLAHADDVLDDHAPHWLRHTVPPTPEWANFIRDDLEMLGDFLAIVSDACLSTHPAISDICEILNEQSFLAVLVTVPLMAYGGNVIRFPVEKRF